MGSLPKFVFNFQFEKGLIIIIFIIIIIIIIIIVVVVVFVVLDYHFRLFFTSIPVYLFSIINFSVQSKG